MSIFWVLIGSGVLIFLTAAGVALIIRADKDPFVGSVLDDKNVESLFKRKKKK